MFGQVFEMMLGKSSGSSGDGVLDVNDRFPKARRDRMNLIIWSVFVIVGIICLIVQHVLVQDGGLHLLLFLFGLACVGIAAGWMYMSVKYWSKEYTRDPMGFIVPEGNFHMSLLAGRASDPFIERENRMRMYLFQCHAPALPEYATHKNFIWRCVDIDERQLVFEFEIHNLLDGYEFLKKNADRLAAQFGDPDGAELRKVGDNTYELVIDSLNTDFWSKGVSFYDKGGD